MKRLPLDLLLCCMLVTPVVLAQDPVKLSPQYYKVLIDNDEVRVLEYRLKPGEKEPMHSHPRGFVYYLANAKLRVSFPDGKIEESELKVGEAHWRAALTHAIENIGKTEAHAVALELKKPANWVATSIAESAQDPAKLAPQNYKVVFENDQMRVIDYRLKPGEKEPMHSHPQGVFVYFISEAKIKTTLPDGKTTENSSKSGDTVWRDPVTHMGENVGDSEAHAILIEPKGSPQQKPLTSETMNQPPEFDHIALHVRELERSAEFYRTVLGLEQVPDPFKDGRHVFFRLGPHSQLHLIAGGQADMERDIDVHFALKVPSLPAFVTSLQEKHVKYFSTKRREGVVTKRPDGVKQVYLQDPDGYWIELNDSRL
jgi:lactoylglutathione lyase